MNGSGGKKIGLISPCGWGNLGDAAIVDAVIHHLRSRLPDVSICAFTMNPEDTAARHQIPSFRITELSLNHYHTVTTCHKDAAQDTAEEEDQSGVKAWVAQQVKGLPGFYNVLSKAYWRIRSDDFLLKQARNEFRHIWKWLRLLRSFDCLIVSGGGQLDEFWGGPWGHPYALFRWALIAAVTKTRFIILSVGTSSLDSSLSRMFVSGALRLADYRSFRDCVSKERVSYVKPTAGDPVIPDLAYSLPVSAFWRTRQVRERLVVGVSPIAYCDPRVWPVADQERYGRYLEELASFVAWLLGEGHHVLLFASDRPDLRAIDDLTTVLKSKVPPPKEESISGPPDLTVEGLLSELVDVDYVVTSRLHGVILSHVLNLPVLAISYDNKVDTHMKNVGQTDNCLCIDGIRCEDIISRFNCLKSNVIDGKAVVSSRLAEYKTLLEEQYDAITSSLG